jgi:hypothetical protein
VRPCSPGRRTKIDIPTNQVFLTVIGYEGKAPGATPAPIRRGVAVREVSPGGEREGRAAFDLQVKPQTVRRVEYVSMVGRMIRITVMAVYRSSTCVRPDHQFVSTIKNRID